MLQAQGPHFCIGGSPYQKTSVCVRTLATQLVAISRACCQQRALSVPVVAALHGHVAGGGIALALNAVQRLADAATTFEHGNLPRGVCPIGGFSQTLLDAIGDSHASAFYLTNVKLDSCSALAIGLVHRACGGVHATQRAAHELACVGNRFPQVYWGGGMAAADANLLMDEATYHAKCRVENGGEAPSSSSLASICPTSERHVRIASVRFVSPAPINLQLLASKLTLESTATLNKSATECVMDMHRVNLQLQQVVRLLPCIDVGDKARDRYLDTLSEPPFQFRPRVEVHLAPTLLRIQCERRVGIIELNATSLDQAVALAFWTSVQQLVLEDSVQALRVITLHVRCSSRAASIRPSAYTIELVKRSLDSLFSLNIPIICSVSGCAHGIMLSICSASEYCFVNPNAKFGKLSANTVQRLGVASCVTDTNAEASAESFAGQLAMQPSNGVRRMLALTRLQTRPRSTVLHPGKPNVALQYLLASPTSSCERALQLQVNSVQQSVSKRQVRVFAPRCASKPRLYTTWMLRTAKRLPWRSYGRGPSSGICAMELYLPRRSFSAAAMEMHCGQPGMFTHGKLLEQIHRNLHEEDALTMAYHSMQRVMQRHNLPLSSIGRLSVATHSALDRSKSIKSEIMALIEPVATDVEGVDEYCGVDALLSSVTWVRGPAWDGRYAVAICADTASTASVAHGAAACAMLVGRAAPLVISTSRRYGGRMKSLKQVSLMQTVPIDESPKTVKEKFSPSARRKFDFCLSTAARGFAWIGKLRTTAPMVALQLLLNSLLSRPTSLSSMPSIEITPHIIANLCGPGHALISSFRTPVFWAPNSPPEAILVSVGSNAGRRQLAIASTELSYMPGIRLTPVVTTEDRRRSSGEQMAELFLQPGQPVAVPTLDVATIIQEVCSELLPSSATVDQPLMEAGLDSLGAVELTKRLGEQLKTDLGETVIFDFPTMRQLAAHLQLSVATGTSQPPAATMSSPATSAISPIVDVAAVIKEVCSELLPSSATVDQPLMEAGLDSLGAVELTKRLGEQLKTDLGETVIFDFPTMRQLAAHLQPAAPLQASPACLLAPSSALGCSITVTALSLKLPVGLESLCAHCEASASSTSVIEPVPASRWTHVYNILPEGQDVKHRCMAYGGFMARAHHFDNRQFAVSPIEAYAMDPQQRLLVEQSAPAAAALNTHSKAELVGIAVGITQTEFARILEASPLAYSVQATTGATLSIASGRLSYIFGFQGPCAAFETACSSALLACHAASLSLNTQESSNHVVAGVNMMLHPSTSLGLASAGMTSPHGRSFTFDKRADGFVRAEGCSAMALTASTANDHADAILHGSSSKQDGRSASLTAPNGQAQQRLLRAAQAAASVQPSELSVCELHGTGTPLGDPIEMSSLHATIVSHRTPAVGATGACSWKANGGHAESAAGASGTLHLIICLRFARLSPNAELRILNPHVRTTLSNHACALPISSAQRHDSSKGAVSSFGFSGTIVHIILQAAPQLCPTGVLPIIWNRRRSFAWTPYGSTQQSIESDAEAVSCFAIGWNDTQSMQKCPTELGTQLLIQSDSAQSKWSNQQLPFSRLVLVCTNAVSSTTAMSTTEKVLSLGQTLAVFSPTPSLTLITCEVQLPIVTKSVSAPAVAHGALLGIARILHIEHGTMDVCACDMMSGYNSLQTLAYRPDPAETEWADHNEQCFLTRLRLICALSCSVKKPSENRHSTFYITGGLGGLGLRATEMLAQSRDLTHNVVLVSRSGTIVRSSHGLTNQLQRLTHTQLHLHILACDVADGMDTRSLVGATLCKLPISVLHAAGMGNKGLFATITNRHLAEPFSAKANGASNILAAAQPQKLIGVMLFSSIAAIAGQVGQSSYAAANSHLDRLSQQCRLGRTASQSVQFPLIRGSGMGAADMEAAEAAGRTSFQGLPSLSLDNYAYILHRLVSHTGPRLPSVCLPQTLDGLLQSVPDTFARRFTQLNLKSSSNGTSTEYIGGTPEQRRARLTNVVMNTIGQLSSEPVHSVDAPLMEAGIDSLAATELSARLRKVTSLPLAPTLLFEQPTARAISTHILEQLAGASTTTAVHIARNATTEPPCVCVVRGRWPGGGRDDYARQRSMLQASGNALSAVPAKRWTETEAAEAMPSISSKHLASTRHGGFVAWAEQFDAAWFRVSPAEAEAMDPQQRLLLEVGYTGLHESGYRRVVLMESDSAVFVGIERPDWALLQALRRSADQSANVSAFAVTADTINVAAGRLSFVLGLQGPCVSMDTACASALTALHAAACAVTGGECVSASALAVSLKLVPQPTLFAAAAGMLSVDGRCKTLDSRANGYVRSEGVGTTVLGSMGRVNRLSAVDGSAVRQDGRSASLTAPNGSAQRQLLRCTLDRAGACSERVCAVEAHGTGTPLGDPTEVAALMGVLTEVAAACGERALGAAKANVGHAEAASGQVALLNVVQQIGHHEGTVGNGQLRHVNPLVASSLRSVPQVGLLLPMHVLRGGRRASSASVHHGVSAFGYSGTIAHALFAMLNCRGAVYNFQPSSPNGLYQRVSIAWRDCPIPERKLSYIEFLGQLVSDSGREKQWGQCFYRHELAFLQGHRVGWVSLLPGTCYIEFARALVLAEHGQRPFTLSRTKFENILFLDDADIRGIPQVRLHLDSQDGALIISSRTPGAAWIVNATMALQLTLSIQADALVIHKDHTSACGASYVAGAQFYAQTGNDYQGEFRALQEAWNSSSRGILSRVAYSRKETQHVCLRTCAWLDVCSHAALWWTDHQRRGFYAASVSSYNIQSTDVSHNQFMWALSIMADGTRTGSLYMHDASLACSVHVQGGTFASFEIGWLESRRAMAHLYHICWQPLPLESTRANCSALLIGENICASNPPRPSHVQQTAANLSVWALQMSLRIEVAVELLLSLFQVNAQMLAPVELLLATVSTQPVQQATVMHPENAGGWGLCRSVRQELSNSQVSSMDLCQKFTSFLPALMSNVAEAELAIHRNSTWAPRLDTLRVVNTFELVHLQLSSRGALSNLMVAPQAKFTCPPDHSAAEIAVCAVGLNFRDVLNVLGEYPGDPGPPGGDCSGISRRNGGQVRHFNTGNPVFGFACGSLASLALSPANLLTCKPTCLSHEKSSSLPITWTTTHAALAHAKLQRSCRLLVHTAAGGVGLVALEYAAWLGYSIGATAGQPSKHGSIAVQRCRAGSSRSAAAFAIGGAMQLHGQRLSMTLNSLSGDFLTASFALLGEQACFEEIGKRAVWSDARAHAATPHCVLCTLAVDMDMHMSSLWMKGLLARLRSSVQQGVVQALPIQSFAMVSNVHAAFRLLQRGANIGKVVVRVAPARQNVTCKDDGVQHSQLISGGTSGLGLLTARWQGQLAPCMLLLLSRSGYLAHCEDSKLLAETRAELHVQQCDVSNTVDTHRAVLFAHSICPGRPNLRRVWHAAGVLDDSMLKQQNAHGVAGVIAPKANGALNMHISTAKLQMHSFAYFSSVAALLGGAGQANYSAANACLDSIASQNCCSGKGAVSIQWGPWAQLGMAADLSIKARMEASGFGLIHAPAGVATLQLVVQANGPGVVAMMPVAWNRLPVRDAAPGMLTNFVSNHADKRNKAPHTCKRLAWITLA